MNLAKLHVAISRKVNKLCLLIPSDSTSHTLSKLPLLDLFILDQINQGNWQLSVKQKDYGIKETIIQIKTGVTAGHYELNLYNFMILCNELYDKYKNIKG